MSEEATKTEEQELEELEAEILGSSEEETEEEKSARIAAEQQAEQETDEERIAREKEEAETAEAERVAALSEEERGAEKQKADDASEAAKAEEDTERERNGANAHARHKIKELQARVAEYEKKPDPTGETAESSVAKLVKVWADGDGDEGAHLANIRKASPDELADIHQKALEGAYGSHGEDVVKTVAEAMPMAMAQERRVEARATGRRQELLKAFEQENELAQADFPDYAKEDSEATKAKAEFDKRFLGTLDPKTGEPDGMGELPEDLTLYLHSHPYVHHQLVNAVFKANTLNSDTSKAETAKLTKERDSYKERLAKYESVESPSPSSAQTEEGTGGETLEDMEKQILSLAGG